MQSAVAQEAHNRTPIVYVEKSPSAIADKVIAGSPFYKPPMDMRVPDKFGLGETHCRFSIERLDRNCSVVHIHQLILIDQYGYHCLQSAPSPSLMRFERRI